MFKRFYTTQMSADGKELRLRFTKIRAGSNRGSKIISIVMAIAIALTTISATIVMAAMDNLGYGNEYGGAMYTFYAYPQEDMEYNVNAALGIYNEKYSDALLYPTISSVRYGYNLFERYFTPLLAASLDNYYLIDSEGSMLDFYNRQEPYYGVIKFWLPKDRTSNSSWNYLEQIEFKTMTISGKEVTVCFADDAISYQNDPVLAQMIEKQILFELNYQSSDLGYNHYDYISEIIDRGVYVIRSVFPKESIQSYSCYGGHYGDFTEEAIIEENVNNAYIQANRRNTFFNDRLLVPKNIDGNQAQKLCEVTVNPNECLILDVKSTTNKMPYVNYKLIAKDGLPYYSVLSKNGSTVQPGEAAEVFMMNVGGSRRNYFPFHNDSSGVTYEVWVSGPESDYAELDIYTYKLSDNANPGTGDYQQIWRNQFVYDKPYGIINISTEDEMLWMN